MAVRIIPRDAREFNRYEIRKNYLAYTSSQESIFWPRDLSYMSQHTVAGLPFFLTVNMDVYVAITEANINNYPGFYMGAFQTLPG
jgi:alpha-glucosidase